MAIERLNQTWRQTAAIRSDIWNASREAARTSGGAFGAKFRPIPPVKPEDLRPLFGKEAKPDYLDFGYLMNFIMKDGNNYVSR
ncbi:MAG: hypothetical protein LBT05_08415 [Planctomycetaceae bacterium]|jgi:hypothetical protein|nr:hypothetical protein [Planctomycetaceae bacterium]